MPFNPFDAWPISGTWADHMSYSAGGEDYPTPYGYVFPAPASGILRSSGGSGEWAAGWIGSAGRRSILSLDTPIRDLTAIVFQHQAAFGREGHYVEGDPGCGTTGASANGSDWGGDVHMHWHGLNAGGSRLCMSNYVTGSETASGDRHPIDLGDDEMIMISATNRGVAIIGPGYYRQLNTDEEVIQGGSIVTKTIEGNDRQFDLWVSIALAGRGATSDGTAAILAEIQTRLAS